MATVGRGGRIKLTVQFYEYAGGPPYDPDAAADPILTILLDGEMVAGPYNYDSGSGPVVRQSTGAYSYVWEVPVDADIAPYVARWEGEIHGVDAGGEELFEVIIPGSVNTGTGSTATLKEDQELVFFSDAKPMYVDPDELTPLFPDATYVEIVEFIYYYSLEAMELLGLDVDDEPSNTARDFVRAAAACALSKIYDYSGVGDETSVKLGDLSITNRAFPKSTVDRRTATTWCELAGALRLELTRGATGLKVVVRGSNYKNPIPVRTLRRHD